MGGSFKQGIMGSLKSAAIGMVLGAMAQGVKSRQTGGKYASGADTSAETKALASGSREPDPLHDPYEGDANLGLGENCTGSNAIVNEATARVNSLLRSGALQEINEYNEGWIDSQHSENPNAFKVHWDPDRKFGSDQAGAVDWGHNDIYNNSGIYLHCAPSIRTAARIIFHEIAHDYPLFRTEWFRATGYDASGWPVRSTMSQVFSNSIKSEVHWRIQSATNRAMGIYDKKYGQ